MLAFWLVVAAIAVVGIVCVWDDYYNNRLR